MTDDVHLPLDAKVRIEAESLIDTLRSLPAVRRHEQEINQLLKDIKAAESANKTSLIVCLVGSTGAGKSTLINALAGVEIALEGLDRPTTSAPTIYAPDDADLNALPNACGAQILRYRPGAGVWSGHVFIDTPDVNSIAEDHRAVAAALADASDVLVVVMHRQSVTEEAAVKFLDSYDRRRHLVFVLGRCDELSEDSRQRLVAQTRVLISDRWRLTDVPLFALSASTARSDPRAGGDFPELVGYLRSIEDACSVKRVVRDSVCGAAERLAETFETIRAEAGVDISTFEGDVRGMFARVKDRFEKAVSLYLAGYTEDIDALLRAELAYQWNGVIGTVLGMGATRRLSLGLSGLLARSTPVLAAALLGGAQLYDNRVIARRRRTLVDPDLGQEIPQRVAQWCREEDSGFRLRGSRLGVEVPDISQSLTSLLKEHMATDGGSRILRDFPYIVGRALPKRARTLMTLPLYALGAWLGVRACYGIATDDLIAFDLILSIAIVAGAWVTLVVFVAQSRIRVATRRILTQLSGSLGSEFDRAADMATTKALEPLRAVHKALHRLSLPLHKWPYNESAHLDQDPKESPAAAPISAS